MNRCSCCRGPIQLPDTPWMVRIIEDLRGRAFNTTTAKTERPSRRGKTADRDGCRGPNPEWFHIFAHPPQYPGRMSSLDRATTRGCRVFEFDRFPKIRWIIINYRIQNPEIPQARFRFAKGPHNLPPLRPTCRRRPFWMTLRMDIQQSAFRIAR